MKKRNLLLTLGVLCASISLTSCNNEETSTEFNPNNNLVVLVTSNIKGDVLKLKNIKGLKSDLESKGAEVILLDSGNFLAGSKYTSFDSGKTFISLMKEVGYNAVNLGAFEFAFGNGKVGNDNHEVFYEDGTLGSFLKEASLDAVSNIKINGTEYAYNSSLTITTKNNKKVEIAGVIDENAPSFVLESNFDTLDCHTDPTVTQELLEKSTADYKICLENYTYDRSDYSSYCDINSKSLTNGNFKIEGYSINNKSLGFKDFTKEITNYESNDLDSKLNDLEKEIEGNEDTRRIFGSEVTLNGSSYDNRTKETNLGDFWCDALKWYALNGVLVSNSEEVKLEVSEDKVVSIWNGGNLRDYLYAGDVSMKDLKRVLPYPNKIGIMYLKGKELLELLEVASMNLTSSIDTLDSLASFMQVSGINYTINTKNEYSKGEAYGKYWYRDENVGSRVTINSINGKEFNEDETYAVVTSNAILNGMDSNYVSLNATSKVVCDRLIRECIPEYVFNGLDGDITSKYSNVDNRIIIK